MKILLTMILGSACLYGTAQDFKEGLLYGVTGHVKEVSLHRNGAGSDLSTSFFDSAIFTPNGKTENSLTVFDDNGYPISLTIDPATLSGEANGMSTTTTEGADSSNPINSDLLISLKFNYDNDHRLASTSLNYNIDLSEMGIPFKKSLIGDKTFQYSPTASGVMEIRSAKEVYKTTPESDDTTLIDCVYSNYAYDKQGNWILRSVKQTVCSPNNPDDGKTFEYEETRTITYYD